jgi:hypothetical protein
MKVGDVAYLAQYAGAGAHFPQNELSRFQDIDGSVVRRVTSDFVWLELKDGNKSEVPRKWCCLLDVIDCFLLFCYYCLGQLRVGENLSVVLPIH